MSAESKLNLDILSRQVSYSGEGISVKSLEGQINSERDLQNSKVDELKVLRERNVEIQTAMTDELKKLRKFSDYLNGTATKDGFWPASRRCSATSRGSARCRSRSARSRSCSSSSTRSAPAA
jgi:hypothetical protein